MSRSLPRNNRRAIYPPSQNILNDFMDNIFSSQNRSTAKYIPVDIINEEKTIYIYAQIAGTSKEKINLDFYNNQITISANKIKEYENTPEINEIEYGLFERVITLPICITRKETVNVSYVNGILKIKIDKLIEEENKFSVSLEQAE